MTAPFARRVVGKDDRFEDVGVALEKVSVGLGGDVVGLGFGADPRPDEHPANTRKTKIKPIRMAGRVGRHLPHVQRSRLSGPNLVGTIGRAVQTARAAPKLASPPVERR